MALSTSDVVLRLARPSDAPRIAALSRELIEFGLPWSWTPPRVAASIVDRDTNVVVALVAGALVGFGIMRYRTDQAELQLFAVRPEHRRQGIGRRLLTWLEEPARAGGLAVVWLEVRSSNHAAQAFYESMGYGTVETLPGYYQGRESALRMGRTLAAAGVDASLGADLSPIVWRPIER